MLEYIYLAVAAILVVGIAIVGVVMYRRDGEAGLEGMAVASQTALAEPDHFGETEPSVTRAGSTAAAASAVWEPSEPALGPTAYVSSVGEQDQRGVEQVLAAWRAESSDSNGGPKAAPASAAAAIASATVTPGAKQPVPGAPTSPAGPVLVAAPDPALAPTPAPAPAVPTAPAVAAYSASGNGSATAALLADPLGVVVVNMADGKGKLTGQELKRLDVFRPESIERAAETVQLPPRLANDQEAVLRLAQIRLYGATLELRAKWAAQMPRTTASSSDAPLTAREFKLKMARDIMALPTPDRAEVIGFLLGGLLGTNGSGPDLKRAVIDTLEHLHSAALVNVLLDCLDDPDPIIQEYALAAADRLLEG
jgi:hypothetical protein